MGKTQVAANCLGKQGEESPPFLFFITTSNQKKTFASNIFLARSHLADLLVSKVIACTAAVYEPSTIPQDDLNIFVTDGKIPC